MKFKEGDRVFCQGDPKEPYFGFGTITNGFLSGDHNSYFVELDIISSEIRKAYPMEEEFIFDERELTDADKYGYDDFEEKVKDRTK